MVEDFCDGALFTHHPLFSQDPNALQFVADYYKVLICNPLGAHVKKHKLGIVFYTLGNIAPKFRSQLKLINLAIVATVPIIEKYGLDYVLKPFIADLNTLATTVKAACKGISVTKHVRQQRNENENYFFKPPRSLAARLPAKNNNNAPLNCRGMPWTETEIPALAVLS